MKNPAGGGNSFECGGLQDAAGSVLSDLLSVMERIQACIRVSESAASIAGPNNEEAADDFIILDDVTPRLVMVSGSLNACHIALGEAVFHLLEAKIPIVGSRIDQHLLSI
jgi:hypothetical protein